MATARPTVSVVMACLNSAPHVAVSVASALTQTFADIELIVVDNGSTDNTVRIVEAVADARVRLLREPVRGVSAARNLGVREARGELLAFLDSDDTWAPDCLSKLHAALSSRPEAALAYCGWQNLGLPGRRGEPHVPSTFDGMTRPEELLVECPWPIHAALTRTDVVRTLNGFEPSLAVGEDFLIWLEIACFHPIVRVPEVLAYYHHHLSGQATHNALRAALQALAAQELFLNRHREIAARLGRRRIRDLTVGRLMQRGYESYWKGDFDTARGIFRRVIRSGYGTPRDWTYMLPSLLPCALHRQAVGVMRSLKS